MFHENKPCFNRLKEVFYFLADPCFSISLTPAQIQPPNGPKLLFDKKKDFNQYMINRSFILRITSKHSPPKPIPSGKIYIFVRNRLNLVENEPVVMCEGHGKLRGEGGVLMTNSPDMGHCSLDSKHRGLVWTIPELEEPTTWYESTLAFGCCTHDASYATKYSKWLFCFFGSGGFADEAIISEFESFKVMRIVRKSTYEKPGIEEKGEPKTSSESSGGKRSLKLIKIDDNTKNLLKDLMGTKKHVEILNQKLVEVSREKPGGTKAEELVNDIEARNEQLVELNKKLAEINSGRKQKLVIAGDDVKPIPLKDIAMTERERAMISMFKTAAPDQMDKMMSIINDPKLTEALEDHGSSSDRDVDERQNPYSSALEVAEKKYNARIQEENEGINFEFDLNEVLRENGIDVE